MMLRNDAAPCQSKRFSSRHITDEDIPSIESSYFSDFFNFFRFFQIFSDFVSMQPQVENEKGGIILYPGYRYDVAQRCSTLPVQTIFIPTYHRRGHTIHR